MNKKICFLLPGQGNKPSGGIKIVYEYADGLAGSGYDVEVYHIAWLYNTTNIIKGFAKYLVFFFAFKPKTWFVFKNKVKLKWCFFPIRIKADFIIATAWETAEILNNIKNGNHIPLYLVQDDESKFDRQQKKGWEQRVILTWQYPWKKIVVSDFLKQKIEKYNANLIKIVNAIDLKRFKVISSIAERNILRIAMLAHRSSIKGTIDGLRALEIVRNTYKDLEVTFFSVYPKMDYIPNWIDYKYNPKQEELIAIYNNASIFISSSLQEGFGLPVAEAMACGCCTVITDIPAYHDFTIPNETSLYSPAGNYETMAENIIRLIEDDTLRQTLAKNSVKHIKEKLSFERSLSLFINVLQREYDL